MKYKNLKYKSSVFLIWLFVVSGIFGVLSQDYSEWFLEMTPIHLLVLFIIFLINIEDLKLKDILALSVPFILGFFTEALGVNYGLIFGNYSYGENLGYKFFGVPLMICVNWALLTGITSDIAISISKNLIVSAFLGALLMVGLDFLLEVSAPRFDFWEFDGGVVPLQNYTGWLVTAFVAHLGYQFLKPKTNKLISWHIFVSIAVFFAVFLFF